MRKSKLLSIFLLLLVSVLLFSCNKKLNYNEFIDFVNDPNNGLVITKEINGIKTKVTYWPQELIAWQDLRAINQISDSLWNATLTHYKQNHYLKVELSYGGREVLNAALSDMKLYSQLVNKLSFGMKEYSLLIEQPQDTLQFIDSYIPRFYGIASTTELTVIYKATMPINSDLRFDLKDIGIGTGDIRFVFKKDKLKSIPEFIYY